MKTLKQIFENEKIYVDCYYSMQKLYRNLAENECAIAKHIEDVRRCKRSELSSKKDLRDGLPWASYKYVASYRKLRKSHMELLVLAQMDHDFILSSIEHANSINL